MRQPPLPDPLPQRGDVQRAVAPQHPVHHDAVVGSFELQPRRVDPRTATISSSHSCSSTRCQGPTVPHTARAPGRSSTPLLALAGPHRVVDDRNVEPDPSPSRTPDDLLLFELGRRVLRRDVERVAGFGEGLHAGTRHLDQRRQAEFAELVEELCDDLVGELGFEEALVWPLLERFAPEALPYPSLRRESAALVALVAEARRSTRAVNADRARRPATLATPDDHRRLGGLAVAWRQLADAVDGFFAASTRPVVEAVHEWVPAKHWGRVLEVVRESLPDARSAGARVVELATSQELERLRGQLGPRPLAGWERHGRRRRARQDDVFGRST